MLSELRTDVDLNVELIISKLKNAISDADQDNRNELIEIVKTHKQLL